MPVIVTEAKHAGPVKASSEAATLMSRPEEAAKRGFGAGFETAPDDQSAVAARAKRMHDRWKPKAIISIERPGPAKDGVVYNATAIPKGPETGIIDIAEVFHEANRRGVFSIGIGDHGNEMGFGRIPEAVARIMPKGDRLCTVVKADVLSPCLMSNWGAYAIEAAPAFLLKKPGLMPTWKTEERIIRTCLDAVGLEAMWCSADFIADSADGKSSMAVAQLLNNLVRLALQAPTRGVAH